MPLTKISIDSRESDCDISDANYNAPLPALQNAELESSHVELDPEQQRTEPELESSHAEPAPEPQRAELGPKVLETEPQNVTQEHSEFSNSDPELQHSKHEHEGPDNTDAQASVCPSPHLSQSARSSEKSQDKSSSGSSSTPNSPRRDDASQSDEESEPKAQKHRKPKKNKSKKNKAKKKSKLVF